MASATACDWHATEARKRPAVTTQEGRAAVPSPSLGGREARAPRNLQDRAPVGEPGPRREPRARRTATRGHSCPTAVPHVTENNRAFTDRLLCTATEGARVQARPRWRAQAE